MVDDYADLLAGKLFQPREWFEHQLHMSDDEKERRRELITKVLEDHNKKRREEAAR